VLHDISASAGLEYQSISEAFESSCCWVVLQIEGNEARTVGSWEVCNAKSPQVTPIALSIDAD